MRVVGATGLTYRYGSGRLGIEDIDLEVSPGEIVALIGPNGSGKTTLLRLLSGELAPQSGSIVILGTPGSASPGLRARIGVVHDQTPHFGLLTGRENARFFLAANGAKGPESERELDALIDRMGLGDAADVSVDAYSFGMRRKLALVEALAHRPELLLLDEPFIGLDPKALGALSAVLSERAASGAATLLATNDLGPVAALCSRVAFFHDGKKVADASPAELLANIGEHTIVEVRTGTRQLRFEVERGASELPRICQELVDAGDPPESIQVREPGLAEVFRFLTGVDLEDRL